MNFDPKNPPPVVFPLSATPLRKRRMLGVRALDYRRDGRRYQRCSRCHAERDMAAPVLYRLGEETPTNAMDVLMLGQNLLGFICRACVLETSRHILELFPHGHGFPFVDQHGQLQPVSRCTDCKAPLVFSNDGRTVLCPQCDGPETPAEPQP